MRRRAACGVVLGGLALPAFATDYESPVQVLDAIDDLEAEVEARLSSLAGRVAGVEPLRRSIAAAHARHRVERDRLRARRGLPPGRPPGDQGREGTLADLRDAAERLVYAHAEGIGVLDTDAVAVVASHLVTLSGHLTVIDLWIDQGNPRG